MSDPVETQTDDANHLLAARRTLVLLKASVAEDRWRRFQRASHQPLSLRLGSRLLSRANGLLARGKWPGRALMVWGSGLWNPAIDANLGREPGVTRGLVDYTRAGPEPLAHPRALFDQTWYLEASRDLVGSRWSPLAHYVALGDKEGRSPHPLINLSYYRSVHGSHIPAVDETVLQHFISRGANSGLDPHPLFDVRHYVGQVEELAASGENPLIHYLREGWRRNYSPHPLFDGAWYLRHYPDVAERGIAPLLHYVTSGASEGRSPHPLLDVAWFADRYRDGVALGSTPLQHLLADGANSRKTPNLHFDAAHYRQQVAQGALDRHPLLHYMQVGAFEGLSAASDFDEGAYLVAHPEAAQVPISGLEHWVQSQTAKPHLTPATARASGTDMALFEQLRAGRHRDAGAYDIEAYQDLARQTRARARQRIEAFKPRPAKLIRVADGELDKAIAALAFPVVRTPKATIIIPAFNNLKFTVECLASLRAAGGLETTQVLLIDDASTDKTSERLAKVTGLNLLTNLENLGFIRTCNRAAEAAKGTYLIFLNNDVQVQAGWLAALLAPFSEEANVGATAPKMLFPDGRLQEAGGRISPSGTAEMIGLFEDPDLLRWNVRREVDYASGACLAVRRDQFRKLKGFDLTFAPAYCEDADLCFRLRKAGLRIIYEPRAVIVHHLSVTSNSINADYKTRLATRNQQRFVERWAPDLAKLNQVRTIAFHLPQFHTIPENDRWWGAGFTEWTNVTRALPNFRGHYQPHLPADLGFYDLSDPDALKRQGDLARRYGVGGFCHYFYWFSGGKRVLEKPLEHVLSGAAGDFPFCLCWANENWTRTWDGQSRDVLLAQTYADGDAEALITELIAYLQRPNYIRVNGRPLLLIYRPGLLPDPLVWTETWREACRQAGIGEIYLAYAEHFEMAGGGQDPKTLGFDASVEFPPAGTSHPIAPPGPLFNARFEGQVNDYRALVGHYVGQAVPAHTRFRGAMPSWDNTARRQDGGWTYQQATPGAFQAWLEAIFAETRRQNFGDEQIVFINAWNEWAEGAHLEPDQRFGHGWLEAVQNAADADLLDPA